MFPVLLDDYGVPHEIVGLQVELNPLLLFLLPRTTELGESAEERVLDETLLWYTAVPILVSIERTVNPVETILHN